MPQAEGFRGPLLLDILPAWEGWDSNTWILAGCLILNNFLVADQMRNLTSIAKLLG